MIEQQSFPLADLLDTSTTTRRTSPTRVEASGWEEQLKERRAAIDIGQPIQAG